MRIAGYCLAAASALALATAAQAQDIAIRGGEVHTMAGPAITDGVVVIDDGKIVAVGPAASIAAQAAKIFNLPSLRVSVMGIVPFDCMMFSALLAADRRLALRWAR